MRLCVLLRSARQIAMGNNTLTIRTFLFSPPHECKHTHARKVFASSFPTGPPGDRGPGDRGALHCCWNIIATQPIGLVPFQARGILPVAEEQSRNRGNQSSGVEDQPQWPGLFLVATPVHAPSRAPLLLPLLLSHNLPLLRVHECVMGRLVHTDFGSSSLVAHVIHYHPPPTRSFVIGTAVINTHGYGKPEAQDLSPKARRMVPLSLLATARRH